MRCFAVIIVALTWTWSLSVSADSGAASHALAQARMVDEVVRDFKQTAYLTGVDAMSEALAEAMRTVPRHAFVNSRNQAAAYANRPLPIGHGQTISQPFIVALMTALATVGPHRRVLEIGTGSGYQAAFLEQLAPRGRLVIPLDTPQSKPDLTLFEKQPDGSVSRRSILPVHFVPLVDGN